VSKMLGLPITKTMTKTIALCVVMTMCLLSTPGSASGAQAQGAAGERPVAHNDLGQLTSRIVGTTGNGRKVTGAFVPLGFAKRDGKVIARGLIQGVVHERNGDRTTFATMKRIPLSRVNGAQVSPTAGAASGRATCDILHLVLGPLHLDLLGLQVDLNRVVLNIVAESGAGNLLGNLLCAVTGLLDGAPGPNLLGRLSNLLNQILGALRLG